MARISNGRPRDNRRDDTPRFTRPKPLTPDQRVHLVRRLLEERNQIVRRLVRYGRGDAEGAGTPNRVPLHMADVGSETMQESLDAAFASRDSETLGEIDRALRGFYRDPDRFGLDEQSGEPIAFERLDIIPWTRRA